LIHTVFFSFNCGPKALDLPARLLAFIVSSNAFLLLDLLDYPVEGHPDHLLIMVIVLCHLFGSLIDSIEYRLPRVLFIALGEGMARLEDGGLHDGLVLRGYFLQAELAHLAAFPNQILQTYSRLFARSQRLFVLPSTNHRPFCFFGFVSNAIKSGIVCELSAAVAGKGPEPGRGGHFIDLTAHIENILFDYNSFPSPSPTPIPITQIIIKISQLYTDYSIKSYPIIVFSDEMALSSLSFIYFYIVHSFGRF
jgi:hypothetical protein